MPEIVIPYYPRPLQREIHKGLDNHRFALLVCHRRFGKTVAAIMQLIKSALTCERRAPRFAYMAPLYRQAKDIAWDYLVHYTAKIPGRKAFRSELRIDLPNGARIQLYGADNPDALRGIYLDGVVLDEYGQIHSRAWTEIIRPALSDRQGWACFLGTPQGKNQFHSLYETVKDDPAWFSRIYRASETGIIDVEEMASLQHQMDPDEYAQEYECSWSAAIKGAYYARLLDQAREDGRITTVPVDPALLVETWWDLGSANPACWFVQPGRGAMYVVDFWSIPTGTHTTISGMAKMLREWRDAHDAQYAYHRLPFDAGQHDLGAAETRLGQMKAADVGRVVVCDRHHPDDGIAAVKALLPICVFDDSREGSRDGIEALHHYRARHNRITDEYTEPLHDWASHGADAFRTGAMSRGKMRDVPNRPHRPTRRPSAMVL